MDPSLLAPYHRSWRATIDTSTLKISTCTVCLVFRGWNWWRKFLPTKIWPWNRHCDVSSNTFVHAYEVQKLNAFCITLSFLPFSGFLGLLRGICQPGKSINKFLYLLHRTHSISHMRIFFSYSFQEFDSRGAGFKDFHFIASCDRTVDWGIWLFRSIQYSKLAFLACSQEDIG